MDWSLYGAFLVFMKVSQSHFCTHSHMLNFLFNHLHTLRGSIAGSLGFSTWAKDTLTYKLHDP